MTIKKGGSVKWVWSELNTYPHDVHLKQGPKGLKKKAHLLDQDDGGHRTPNSRRRSTTPGTYKFICTIHPTEMKMTVTVKK